MSGPNIGFSCPFLLLIIMAVLRRPISPITKLTPTPPLVLSLPPPLHRRIRHKLDTQEEVKEKEKRNKKKKTNAEYPIVASPPILVSIHPICPPFR